ncbi:MAG: hypothetical protein OXG30_08565, partial [bacterium]|nr:hypothetical protein [bacterium]
TTSNENHHDRLHKKTDRPTNVTAAREWHLQCKRVHLTLARCWLLAVDLSDRFWAGSTGLVSVFGSRFSVLAGFRLFPLLLV